MNLIFFKRFLSLLSDPTIKNSDKLTSENNINLFSNINDEIVNDVQNQINERLLQNSVIKFYIKNTNSNLFITLTSSINNKLSTFSLGQSNLKNKKKRKEQFTLRIILKYIFNILTKYNIKNLFIFFKGLTEDLFDFYKFFIMNTSLDSLKFIIKHNKPHGGCRPPKKPRR